MPTLAKLLKEVDLRLENTKTLQDKFEIIMGYMPVLSQKLHDIKKAKATTVINKDKLYVKFNSLLDVLMRSVHKSLFNGSVIKVEQYQAIKQIKYLIGFNKIEIASKLAFIENEIFYSSNQDSIIDKNGKVVARDKLLTYKYYTLLEPNEAFNLIQNQTKNYRRYSSKIIDREIPVLDIREKLEIVIHFRNKPPFKYFHNSDKNISNLLKILLDKKISNTNMQRILAGDFSKFTKDEREYYKYIRHILSSVIGILNGNYKLFNKTKKSAASIVDFITQHKVPSYRHKGFVAITELNEKYFIKERDTKSDIKHNSEIIEQTKYRIKQNTSAVTCIIDNITRDLIKSGDKVLAELYTEALYTNNPKFTAQKIPPHSTILLPSRAHIADKPDNLDSQKIAIASLSRKQKAKLGKIFATNVFFNDFSFRGSELRTIGSDDIISMGFFNPSKDIVKNDSVNLKVNIHHPDILSIAPEIIWDYDFINTLGRFSKGRFIQSIKNSTRKLNFSLISKLTEYTRKSAIVKYHKYLKAKDLDKKEYSEVDYILNTTKQREKALINRAISLKILQANMLTRKFFWQATNNISSDDFSDWIKNGAKPSKDNDISDLDIYLIAYNLDRYNTVFAQLIKSGLNYRAISNLMPDKTKFSQEKDKLVYLENSANTLPVIKDTLSLLQQRISKYEINKYYSSDKTIKILAKLENYIKKISKYHSKKKIISAIIAMLQDCKTKLVNFQRRQQRNNINSNNELIVQIKRNSSLSFIKFIEKVAKTTSLNYTPSLVKEDCFIFSNSYQQFFDIHEMADDNLVFTAFHHKHLLNVARSILLTGDATPTIMAGDKDTIKKLLRTIKSIDKKKTIKSVNFESGILEPKDEQECRDIIAGRAPVRRPKFPGMGRLPNYRL